MRIHKPDRRYREDLCARCRRFTFPAFVEDDVPESFSPNDCDRRVEEASEITRDTVDRPRVEFGRTVGVSNLTLVGGDA